MALVAEGYLSPGYKYIKKHWRFKNKIFRDTRSPGQGIIEIDLRRLADGIYIDKNEPRVRVTIELVEPEEKDKKLAKKRQAPKKKERYRIKTMSGWWKGRNQFGVPMAGKGTKDALVFESKEEALQEMRNIPAIIGFDGLVPVDEESESSNGPKRSNRRRSRSE